MDLPFVQRGALAAALAAALALASAGSVLAQTPPATAPVSAAPAASAASSARATTLAPVLVTGNPLGSSVIASPSSVLAGDELVLRRGSSLGETLATQPGVSSSYFGPNANRPVIRGLDGDRVRILNNSGASFDASSLSFDHAVPIDPLAVERIEVLRGPGALLYGGSAIGGVVNTVDNRVPKDPVEGVSGVAEVRLGGAERERGGAALVEAGNGGFAVHADAFGRETSDLSVPRYTPVEADGTRLDPTRRVRNSAARTDGGALGASWTGDRGYLGIAADTYDSHYGTVAEEDVTIRMKRDHVGLAGELRGIDGPIRTVRVRVDDTRYRHEEVDGDGTVGTTFKTSGTEARVELEHAPLGPVKGVIGAQVEDTRFSALGDEAFVPSTKTRKGALFVLEEMASPVGTLSFGGRLETARVHSAGDDADIDEPRFGPAESRRFSLQSASLGDVWKLAPAWTLSASLASTERAPTSFELFANGLHAATGAYERGDPTLRSERGNNLDLSLAWKESDSHARLGLWAARFSRFISLEATGNTIPVVGDDGPAEVPEFAFTPVRAQLHGIEFEAGHRLRVDAWTFDFSGKLDATRGSNRHTGEPLPRIAPLRSTLAVDAGYDRWSGRFEAQFVSRQNRVSDEDRATAGYALFNASLSRRFTLGGLDAFAFLKATNLGDKLAYNAATVETIRGLVPLPGRALSAGLRVNF